MKSRGTILSLFIIFTLVAVVAVIGCGPAQPQAGPNTGPIVIGYVGGASSPGTKPVMDMMRIATEEINLAGGMNGRPVKFVIEDSKGETSLAVAAAQRMVMGNKALIYHVEGRTEICLAVQPKSVELFPQFPHILVWQGPMGRELTSDIVKDYDKLKFIFRDWDPEDAHYASIPAYFTLFKEVVKADKIAFLWEDLAWTTVWRNGIPGLPKWEDYAKEVAGLETVYSKPIKARTGMYLPILESLAASGAQVIFVCSSWFTDTEVFAKQWAGSSAKDIPVCFYGGTSHTYDFWDLTGGKALGCMGSFYEKEIPNTPQSLAFLEKADKNNIPVQVNVAIGYADMYLYKKLLETAKTTDVEKLIPALEGLYIEDIGILGIHGIEGKKVAPFFHSRYMANPDNPREPSEIYGKGLEKWVSPIGQFQGPHNVVLLCTGNKSTTYPPRYKGTWAEPEKYKSPAELRKAAGQ
ncbi:MAG: ABC transporter substrate-binding protein [Chloroflexi bacterium]|nr:ABC transporter substrate-binding protein [Chloroflexota bacterium]